MKNFTTSQQAILTTILYSDIFSFPLTRDELWKFLITEKKIEREAFEKDLQNLKKYIAYKNGYYYLSGKEEIVQRRIGNAKEVEKKMQQARFIAKKIASIPSILFIGVSGGLAVGNVSAEDDIDLVIIVRKNTLFVSRLLILILLQRFGVRRSHKQKNTADTICVNLLFDESALDWFGKHQDIYTAREMAQIVPLFEREHLYQKFMDANKWMQRFLPNLSYARLDNLQDQEDTANFFNYLVINPFFESTFRFLQMSLISRHRTTETVTNHLLAFHPNDYRLKTLRQLKLKMRQLGLLTKF